MALEVSPFLYYIILYYITKKRGGSGCEKGKGSDWSLSKDKADNSISD